MGIARLIWNLKSREAKVKEFRERIRIPEEEFETRERDRCGQ